MRVEPVGELRCNSCKEMHQTYETPFAIWLRCPLSKMGWRMANERDGQQPAQQSLNLG